MTDAVAILLSIAGFVLLAAAMARHQVEIAGRRLPAEQARIVRIAGFGLLMAALLLDWAVFGAGYGAVAWFGHLSIGAWVIIAWLCLRAYRKTRAAPTRSPGHLPDGDD